MEQKKKTSAKFLAIIGRFRYMNCYQKRKKKRNYSKTNILIHLTISSLNLILPKFTLVIKETLVISQTEHTE